MKALFCLLDGDTNASSHHRALQFFPLLRAQGIEARASRPVPGLVYDRLVEQSAFGAPQKTAFYGLFLASRLLDVLRAGQFDVVVIQRDLFPFGPPILERLLRRINPRLVYDTDDATYLRPSFTPDTLFQRLRRFEKVEEVVRSARWVSVATEPLAAWARRFNPNVTVVPMAIDLPRYDRIREARAPGSRPGPLTIGWAGTGGGLRYLAELAPVLAEVSHRVPVRVRVISGAYQRVLLPGVDVDARPWRAASDLADLATFDVGLVPLQDSAFERAKFPFKMLQYLALGVPAVCARIGTAARVIHDGENGLLAGSPREWVQQLERALRDAELRRRLSIAGRHTVEERYTIQRVGPLLAGGLRLAAGQT